MRSIRFAHRVCAPLACFAATLLGLPSAPSRADEAIDFFESRIRPVLVEHCYECHAGDAGDIEGGLRLDEPAAMQLGGASGAAVVAGDPEASLLLAAIKYEDFEMPPAGPLDERTVRDFEEWIRRGAAMPQSPPGSKPASPDDPTSTGDHRQPDIDWQEAKSFWSFQPPRRHEPPQTTARDWPAGPIDAFVLHRLESEGLAPNPPAPRRQLLRRLAFDLTGLPPTPEAVERFVADASPQAVENAVDRLLASPTQAEHLARLWLDIARYAEDQAHQVGKDVSLNYPNAYLYRDWVIAALAADMPYDRFVQLQLAADALPPEDIASPAGEADSLPDEADPLAALGFLGLGPKYYRRNSPEVMADEWENSVDTVSRGLLGLTVACARCHDHKYDPIPTADYYSLAGVFASTKLYNKPLAESAKLKNDEAEAPADAMHIVRDGEPVDLKVMVRGDVNRQGELAPRSFLRLLSDRDPPPLTTGSGRLDLARAITDPCNPLTARVIVNRIWSRLIGQPLVATESNFGRLGEQPTHPQLLDDLAVRFMENGWSLKWLQREIVLSSTYAQSSDIDAAKHAIDPQNRWLWRMPRRRLSIEAYRDSILAATARLAGGVGGPSIQPDDPGEGRRTIYAAVSRMELNPVLARFDFPDPNAHSDGRYQTTTPLQKLFMLNSPFLVEQSDALATRLLDDPAPLETKIAGLYQRLYARLPRERERQLADEFLADATRDSWSQYIQAMLISNEMFIVD